MSGTVDQPRPALGPRLRARLQGWVRRHGFGLAITSLLLLFTLVFFWNAMVYTIRPGEAGVSWKRFSGTQIDVVYREGTHFILPWNKLYIYDLRIAKIDHTVPVLSTDGLEINVEVAIRFRPELKTLPQLHQAVGPDYAERIVVPQAVSTVREVIGRYRPEQLYTLRSDDIHQQLVSRAMQAARDHFLVIDDIIIRRIELPQSVQLAIQQKLSQEQEALEYEYRLEKEHREAERKKIEAGGISDFQKAIASGITPAYLQWKGIEATLALAKSTNAKVVIVGGKDGLPLILNTPSVNTPGQQ
jgi:regulator of protease activity HflC (stomatin/prohibitin superfamily)